MRRECPFVDMRLVLMGTVVLNICRIYWLLLCALSARGAYFPAPPWPDWLEQMSREWGVVTRCKWNIVIECVFMAVNSLTVFEMVTSDPIYNNLNKLIPPSWAVLQSSQLCVGVSCSTEVCGQRSLWFADGKITHTYPFWLFRLQHWSRSQDAHTLFRSAVNWVISLCLGCCVHVNTLIISTVAAHSVFSTLM